MGRRGLASGSFRAPFTPGRPCAGSYRRVLLRRKSQDEEGERRLGADSSPPPLPACTEQSDSETDRSLSHGLPLTLPRFLPRPLVRAVPCPLRLCRQAPCASSQRFCPEVRELRGPPMTPAHAAVLTWEGRRPPGKAPPPWRAGCWGRRRTRSPGPSAPGSRRLLWSSALWEEVTRLTEARTGPAATGRRGANAISLETPFPSSHGFLLTKLADY